MIFRVASSIGTASPRPIPATAVLIPTTVPRPSASAPPELPGLSAASVWITFSTSLVARPELRGSARPSALTTPAVTDPENPRGLPIATTSWPTRSFDASPSSAGWRSRPSSRRTARSESSSRPTTSNRSSCPSTKTADPRDVPATTWAEVMANPSEVITTPEPAPCMTPPRPARWTTRRLATEGVRRSATVVTTCEYASSASSSVGCSSRNDMERLTLGRRPICPRLWEGWDPTTAGSDGPAGREDIDEPEDRPVPVVREGRRGGRGPLYVRLRRRGHREEDLLPGWLARPGRAGDDDRLHDRRAAVRRPERRSAAGLHVHVGGLVRRELRHAGGDRPALGSALRGRSATAMRVARRPLRGHLADRAARAGRDGERR